MKLSCDKGSNPATPTKKLDESRAFFVMRYDENS